MPEPKNPFISSLRIEFVVGKATSYYRGKFDTGKETTDFFYRERVEKTCVYKTPEFYNLIPTLKSSSKDLLLFIVVNLGWGKDLIRLDRDRFREWTGGSVQTFYNAVGELVDCGVITRYKGADYWINPMYFFKGNRLNYARENGAQVVAYQTKQQNEQAAD
jgi:hypothetical protein